MLINPTKPFVFPPAVVAINFKLAWCYAYIRISWKFLLSFFLSAAHYQINVLSLLNLALCRRWNKVYFTMCMKFILLTSSTSSSQCLRHSYSLSSDSFVVFTTFSILQIYTKIEIYRNHSFLVYFCCFFLVTSSQTLVLKPLTSATLIFVLSRTRPFPSKLCLGSSGNLCS